MLDDPPFMMIISGQKLPVWQRDSQEAANSSWCRRFWVSADVSRDGKETPESWFLRQWQGRGLHVGAGGEVWGPGEEGEACPPPVRQRHRQTFHRQQLSRRRDGLQESNEEIQGETLPGLPGRGRGELSLQWCGRKSVLCNDTLLQQRRGVRLWERRRAWFPNIKVSKHLNKNTLYV